MPLHTLHELDRTEGTVRLRQALAVAASGGDADAVADRVLVPRPSANDPNDPLRWPRWRKHVAFAAVCAFTFLTNFAIGGLAPAFYPLSLEFDKTASETSALLLWPILVLGVFNFVWVPVANYVGKRPVFVGASALLCASYVWGACAGSFRSLLWSNIVAAFAGSTTEALGASIVNDLYFLHERGAKMGLYMNAIAGGNTIGPLICGFIVTGLSWRWHKWLAVILTALNFLAVLFGVPETRYLRDADQNVGLSPVDIERLNGRSGGGEASAAAATATGNTEPGAQTGDVDDVEKQTKSTGQSLPVPLTSPSSSSVSSVVAVPKKTWLQEISLWSGITPGTSLVRMFARPLPMFAYPCVVYAFLGYAVSLVVTVAVNLLNSFVLQAPPYNWSPSVNGLINIPGFLGNLLGGYAGGWLVDVFCDWRLRRHNNGVFEPESRLYLLVLPALITGAGCVLFGYGVQETLHWTSLFFGYGMVSFALTAVPTITMAYVSDCLLPVNADALMLVNGSKNIVAFGFLYGIVPWVDKVGYVDCFGAQAGIFVAIIALGAAILIPFGAQIRHRQAKWRIIL
ncbi:Major facilitator superfamily domain, general substrate transporter [Niveomyces insectorum RCEF 264]|uniref:Major facilitator superfamily domain, general substrate transporter n=1 Tax=Niveomyces insectorum RCEF 264 TaxID=1081102 RepID=A0A167P3A3_9HYPO|nr:Major facilitator superfamily domain, general substrate transporter [Niveomyces insectorum RCEF 264]